VVDYLKNNQQFWLIAIVWLLVGMYGGPIIWGLPPLTVLLMKKKKMYSELFFGFFFILILSDSRQYSLDFAESIKNVYVVLLALFIFFDFKEFQPFNRLIVRFIPFFLVAFLCLFYSEGGIFFTSLQKTLSYLLIALIVPNYVFKLYREEGTAFLRNLVHFGTLILLVGLVLKFIYPEVTTLQARYCGILGNPNGLGIFTILFFLIFSVVANYYPDLFLRKEKALIYICIYVSIILCGSRTALVGTLIFFIFQYFYRLSPFFGFIVFIIFLMVYQVITTNIEVIVIGLGIEEYFRIETLKSGSGRLVAWQFAWELIQDNMFFGKGFSYTDYIFKQNAGILGVRGHQGNAHNSYLTFWIDTGIVGLVLYLRAFLLSFFQAAKNTVIAIPLMYTIIFCSYFESWLTASLNPFTIQFFIILTIITSEEFKLGAEEAPVPVH